MNLIVGRSKQIVFRRDNLELILGAAVGMALFVLVMAALAIKGQAQQTIFNVPTTDVLDRGYAGYSIGNQNASRGNHYFLLEFGNNFN